MMADREQSKAFAKELKESYSELLDAAAPILDEETTATLMEAWSGGMVEAGLPATGPAKLIAASTLECVLKSLATDGDETPASDATREQLQLWFAFLLKSL